MINDFFGNVWFGEKMGIIFVTIGVLIMLLTGLCTLTVITISAKSSDAIGMFAIASVVGGVPFVVGFALYALGQNMRDKSKESQKTKDS